jgi:adenylate cyclase
MTIRWLIPTRGIWSRAAGRPLYRPDSLPTRLEALRIFERALEIDPRSIEARIGTARVLIGMVADSFSSSVQQDKARAEQLLLEALDRDAHRCMAHAAMGLLRRLQNRHSESRVELEIAIALDPNNSFAVRQMGQTLMFLGHPDAAVPYLEKAIRLSPRDPNLSSRAGARFERGTARPPGRQPRTDVAATRYIRSTDNRIA